MDCGLLVLEGTSVAPEIQQRGLPVRVLALNAYDDERYVRGMLEAGATGYLLKDEAPAVIVAAVRAAAQGEGYFSPPVAAKVAAWVRGERPGGLTEREMEVVRLVAEGLSNKEIAHTLQRYHPERIDFTMNKSRQSFWIGFSMCLAFVILVVGCSTRHATLTQTAPSPSPIFTLPLSPHPVISPSPTPTLTSPPQPTATPIPPSPTPTFTPLPQPTPKPSPFALPTAISTPPRALPSGVTLLASVPISIPLGGGPVEYPSMDWSPNGTVLAYGWGGGIWVVRPPTYEPSLLVSLPEAGQTREVSWSPGGQYLAFYGRQPLEELWGGFIWVVKADGTGLKNLTAGEPFDPYRRQTINQWLDDHTLTIDLWHGTGAQSLWLVDTVSGETARLIGYGDSAIPVQAYGGSYDWSPTQEHIAVNYFYYDHLVLVDVAQTSEIWFSTMEGPSVERFLDWAQDGQWFLYTQWDTDEEGYNLWLWDVAREEGEKLLPHVAQATFSPEGSRVAFLQREDHAWQPPAEISAEVSSERELPALTLGLLGLATGKIVLHGPAGYKAQGVPREPRYWQPGRPAWSPDGELIVYWGEEGDVWLVSADGQWQQRLTQGLEIIQVLWSPDGGKLALRSFDQAWIVERPAVQQVP